MEQYIFIGTVLPERAQISLSDKFKFEHISSKQSGTIEFSIINNQLVVIVETNHVWDILTLRNLVKTAVQNELNKIGFLMGLSYELEIIRILNQKLNIDYVYGIKIECISERNESIILDEALKSLRHITKGQKGIFINRCFSDLIAAMKHADDTEFYCYRAIEALRHHCSATHNLIDSPTKIQWEKFRKIAGCDKQLLLDIKDKADPLRHGNISSASSDDRAELFTTVWDIVDEYLKNI